jgi:hypothetical protein
MNIFWQPLFLKPFVCQIRDLDRHQKDCVVEQVLQRVFAGGSVL